MMRFSLRKGLAILGGAAAILFCSCEEHHLGEMPEVQKEHVDLANADNSKGAQESTSPAPATPTPVDFFPTKNP